VCGDRLEAHADHITPIALGGERYDVANGQTLCSSCHGKKTRAEQKNLFPASKNHFSAAENRFSAAKKT